MFKTLSTLSYESRTIIYQGTDLDYKLNVETRNVPYYNPRGGDTIIITKEDFIELVNKCNEMSSIIHDMNKRLEKIKL